MISYAKQFISKEDIKAVVEVLKSDFITCGLKVQEFERRFSRYTGSKYAVAVSSGTAGLHLACLAAELEKGDELITSPLSFAASANCALYCGAKPIFIDINEQGLMDENSLKKKITKRTKIIIPVHYGGLPCKLDKIQKIAKKYKLIIIEDAVHALGARYKKSKIGDCKYSDMAVFSFHPVKHITTGEGGMITTNNRKYYEKLLMLRTHGITKDKSKYVSKVKSQISNIGSWYHEMQLLGYNYRLTDIQCALGISQLNKIDSFIKKRREIANKYDKAFKNAKNIEIIKESKDQFNAYHLYPVRVKENKTRFRIFNYLKKNNIYCQIHYIPIYWHPYYQKLDYKKGLCSKAEDFSQREISIPLYASLKSEEVNYVINKIFEFF
ncbi:UDP-4-amino-4,6-dideoxy-N-acetyl-beta-L-altrosamine transaminase [Candidatus Beckwithbacteria bacterium CG10_big_fil_rev_8_21_14_0_10_34_10]|uniref:UDP-4-amino-4, 6-dideoxy-N-acetyl-beta-L-altrosamine transaminase n=1 Tax=Candidatus Beckwithbacteria bacterium CG10_big_fil_rev_8_21_14_0_10_34_10 TaxID=1974495 RepID=A0A2H0W984_9BACT|nr:MAG: UDP-4-amino-4,6-dideoxy-N-acetyl-beta-L-altrosamine transaminase [Candidatus Beckwithbacteria bacterium CG10_big_fil_rev_8_21_14_0_10_34_10]